MKEGQLYIFISSKDGRDYIWIGVLDKIAPIIEIVNAHNVRSYKSGGLCSGAAGDPANCTLDKVTTIEGRQLIPYEHIVGIIPVDRETWVETLGL